MAEKIYGFDESKSKVEVPDKATYDADISALESGKVDKTTQSAKDSEQDTSIATAQSTADGKQDPIVAGTGISIGSDGKTINHSNSITAKTSYVGSATSVPRLKFDAQGHITGVSTATIYPPTTPGTSGQVWVSDGNGAGSWQDAPSGEKQLYTGTFDDLVDFDSSNLTITIKKSFIVEFIYKTVTTAGSGYDIYYTSRIYVTPATYKVTTNSDTLTLHLGYTPTQLSGYYGWVFTQIAEGDSSITVSVVLNNGDSRLNLSQNTTNDITGLCYRLFV